MKVRTCAPRPARAWRKTGATAASVLPSPVAISDDPALREGEAGEDLLVERPLPEGAPGRLAGEGEGLGELRLDLRPVGHAGRAGRGPAR